MAVSPARQVLDEQISERQFQASVLDIAYLNRWAVAWVWNSKHSPAGWPDLVLAEEQPLRFPARLLFRELKTQLGKVTDAQQRWGDLLLAAGQDWAVWRPSMFDVIVKQLTR